MVDIEHTHATTHYAVDVQIMDIVYEIDPATNEQVFPNHNKGDMTVTCYTEMDSNMEGHATRKEIGVMSIAKCLAGHKVQIPLSQDEGATIQLVVDMPDDRVGSISIESEKILSGPAENKQWITLFDEDNDDLYDGDIGGEDDLEECPRILLRFKIVEHHQAPVMEKTRKSQAIVAALMQDVDDESSDELPEIQPREPLQPLQASNTDNEWDILKALRARGPYPTWDADWLEKLLQDKIMHLSQLIEEMQRNNYQVEASVLDRLASLKDFSKILKEYLAQSNSEQIKIQGDNQLHKRQHDKILKENPGVEALRKRLEELEKEVLNGRQSMRALESNKLKAVNEFLGMEGLAESNGLATSESKKMLDTQRAQQLIPQVKRRQDVIEKMHEHIRRHQVDIQSICGKVNIYQAAMEEYAEEHANLENEIQRCRGNENADKATEAILKIENDAVNTEVKLLHDQAEDVQNNLQDMENMGEDLAEDLLDKIHTQDEYLADGNMELARESALVRELTARHGDYEDEGDRLKRLRESYARLDAQLDAKTKQFEDSSHLRSQARQRVSNIRRELKGNLDADVGDMNLDEVEALCRKIQSQDETLLFDLQKLKMLVDVDQVTFGERNILANGIEELRDQTDTDERQIVKLTKLIRKYEIEADKLNEKLKDLIEQLRKLKNELLLVRKETIRLDEEIQKLREELRLLHLNYHVEWKTLQDLDARFDQLSRKDHRDQLPTARRELARCLGNISTIMNAIPYQYMLGDCLDRWIGETCRRMYFTLPLTIISTTENLPANMHEKVIQFGESRVTIKAQSHGAEISDANAQCKTKNGWEDACQHLEKQMAAEKQVRMSEFLQKPHKSDYTEREQQEEDRIRRLIEDHPGGVFHKCMGRTHAYHAETQGSFY